MPIESVRLTDLADPELPPELVEARTAMAPVADALEFDADVLRRQAAEKLGLDDFGDPQYEEPFDVLLREFPRAPNLSSLGRLSAHAQLLQLLENRLLLVDLLKRHPEIHEIEVRAPIVICGLPRTGTTHLHNLMAADPGLRSLPYWESVQPVPLPEEVGVEPDPRIARTEATLAGLNGTLPHFRLMHEMTTWHVHEEIQLLAIDFSTMLFDTMALMPGWRDHYLSRDQRPHYRFMKTVLQALQFLRGGTRWVLKSPQHLEQFGALVDVFPDATFVVTHRDPASVVVSMATMAAYTARTSHDPVDPHAIGAYWADRIERMLQACVRDRDALPSDRSIDVRFDDFMADDIAMVQRIYDLAGQPFTHDVDRAMRDYMVEHPRGRHGRVEYRAADLGLDDAELRTRFAFYADRFL